MDFQCLAWMVRTGNPERQVSFPVPPSTPATGNEMVHLDELSPRWPLARIKGRDSAL